MDPVDRPSSTPPSKTDEKFKKKPPVKRPKSCRMCRVKKIRCDYNGTLKSCNNCQKSNEECSGPTNTDEKLRKLEQKKLNPKQRRGARMPLRTDIHPNARRYPSLELPPTSSRNPVSLNSPFATEDGLAKSFLWNEGLHGRQNPELSSLTGNDAHFPQHALSRAQQLMQDDRLETRTTWCDQSHPQMPSAFPPPYKDDQYGVGSPRNLPRTDYFGEWGDHTNTNTTQQNTMQNCHATAVYHQPTLSMPRYASSDYENRIHPSLSQAFQHVDASGGTSGLSSAEFYSNNADAYGSSSKGFLPSFNQLSPGDAVDPTNTLAYNMSTQPGNSPGNQSTMNWPGHPDLYAGGRGHLDQRETMARDNALQEVQHRHNSLAHIPSSLQLHQYGQQQNESDGSGSSPHPFIPFSYSFN